MNRFFLEVSYQGTAYAGFQVQHNAKTVQGEVEKALEIYYRRRIQLTGSSRTDAGVHAKQNYFHFDFDGQVESGSVYNLNAILPADVAVRRMVRVPDGAHCRFDALSRKYRYLVYSTKDPFLREWGYYFPFRVDTHAMQRAAAVLSEYVDFRAFSKRNTQVKTFECRIRESQWQCCEGHMEFHVRANRFLRGMVRGLVGTMLQVGRGKMDVEEFRSVLVSRRSDKVDFAVPGHGLMLEEVEFPEGYFG